MSEISIPFTLVNRTREDLVQECRRIMRNDPWDDGSINTSAERLADLLVNLTGTTGTRVQIGEAENHAQT